MNKKSNWKHMLIACMVAVQCTALVSTASAQAGFAVVNGDVSKSNQQSSQSIEGSSQDAANPSTNDSNSTNSNSSSADPTTGLEGSTSELSNPDGANQTTNPASKLIDTSIYGNDVLVIVANSNIMVQNNVEFKAPEPITIKNGVSFVSLRTLVDRFGFKLTYDQKTKESIITSGNRKLRYKIGTNTYRVNGDATKMSGTSYLQKNTFMVPLTSALQAFQMPYKFDNATKRIIVQMSAAPVAKFSIGPKDILATQTEVKVKDESFHPRGLKIVDYEWSGLETYFAEPGLHTVTLRVLDEKGVWSEPYSVSVNVLPPNLPPVANFTTDKDTYKMGEIITYTDLSTDDEGIEKSEWNNNKKAFFEPGQYTITLRVTDKHGFANEMSKTITITNETLYTFEEFNQLFTGIGEVYIFKGSSIVDMKQIQPKLTHLQRTLYRTNSPESVKQDGILYKDKIAGGTRILLHHMNATSKNMKLYIIAKNISDENATVRVEHAGTAGPSTNPQQTGKMAAVRYFQSYRENGTMSEQTLKPNESTLLLPSLSDRALKPNEVYTSYADFYGDDNLQYQIVALDANKNIWKELPYLSELDPDGTHIRGTFNNADRAFNVAELVGDKVSRLVFADNKTDTYIQGWDTMNGDSRINAGNYGVLYRITLERVAPNTLISFNARGGTYSGAILVNGQTVELPTKGLLNNSNEAGVVYRTGDREEKVEMWFTPAAGSSMPVNLLFAPLPKKHS
ncbi:stalk domain-containing protein [Paenibacillus taiwanensis]|uniref:stalk domain-containing protein n=1 Tax=Paenibacillus taiwanensis TaxID=401638 RepID=UPI00040C8AD9|nr:stalk domain-containing protein [Paenibacillus taiwanensis]